MFLTYVENYIESCRTQNNIKENILHLVFDSPPAHSLILDSADLGVDGLAVFLLSCAVVDEPIKLPLGDVEPELVR